MSGRRWTWPGTISVKLPEGVETYAVLGPRMIELGWPAFPCWIGTGADGQRKVKLPAVKGRTGFNECWVTDTYFIDMIKDLKATEHYNENKFYNTGLRLPKYIVVLDVDVYGNKRGDKTIIDIFGEWPAIFDQTLRVSRFGPESRSGGYFFRSDYAGWATAGHLGTTSGVEICKWSHRHYMSPGSIHHSDGFPIYRSYVGAVAVDMVGPDSPVILDMPVDMAAAIVDYAHAHGGVQPSRTRRVRERSSSAGKLKLDSDYSFLPDVAMCDHMSDLYDKWSGELEGAEDFHDIMMAAVGGLIGTAENGHRGLRAALDALENLFDGKVNARGEPGSSAVGDVSNAVAWVLEEIGGWEDLAHEECGLCDGEDPVLFVEEPAPEPVDTASEQPPPVAEAADTPDYMPMPRIPEDFWDTPLLRQIRDGADHFGAQRGGVLGSLLARWSLLIPRDIQTPYGPFNPYVLLVGASRTGKSWSYQVSGKLFPLRETDCECGGGHRPDQTQCELGSAEGLLSQYFENILISEKPKEYERRQDRYSLLFYVDEGSTLNELSGRQGAGHLLPLLRSAWSDVQLGFGWKNASKDRLGAGEYRLAMVLALQPLKAEFIFADQAGGLFQRCMFFGCQGDTYDGPEEQRPGRPGRLPWDTAQFGRISRELGEVVRRVPVAADVAAEARQMALRVSKELDPTYTVGPLENIDLRMQVAGELAAGHGELDLGITRQWWDKALVLLEHFAGVVAVCEWAIPKAVVKDNQSARLRAVDTWMAVDKAREGGKGAAKTPEDAAREQILKALWEEELETSFGLRGLTRGDLYNKLSKKARPVLDKMLEIMCRANGLPPAIERRETPYRQGGVRVSYHVNSRD